MKVLHLTPSSGRSVTDFESRGAWVASLLSDPEGWHVALIDLEPEGVLGRHAAATEQVLLIVAGEGSAAGEGEGLEPVRLGSILLIAAGEGHELRAGPDGLTAIALEGHGLGDALSVSSAG